MNNIKILVTGGNSNISTIIKKYLLNYNITFLSKTELNLLNFNEIKNYFENNNYDIIIHTAINGSQKYNNINNNSNYNVIYENLLIFENLIKFIDRFKMFINLDSAASYNTKTNIMNRKENEFETIPTDNYDLSKYIIYQRTILYHNIYNLRLFNIFHSNEKENKFIKKCFLDENNLTISEDKYFDFFYEEDFIKVLIYYINNLFNQNNLIKTINICYTEKYKLSEIYELITKQKYKKTLLISNNNYCGNNDLLLKYNINFIGLINGLNKYRNDLNKKIYYAPHMKQAYNNEEINGVIQCLENGYLASYGEKTIEFENKISNIFGKKYGLFVNSGSSAILLGLCSLQLNKNDEIITPVCTFSTTVAPIIQNNLIPVFCDVDINTFVPSSESICEKITLKTKVILLPNLIGSKPNWKELKQKLNELNRNDIILFEDSADTITFTSETDISITSFYSSHIITAGGSGGMLMFNDKKLLNVALMYRDWGRLGDNNENIYDRFNYNIDNIPYDYKFLYNVIGYNLKSSEMNAAFGLVQLNKLNDILFIRRTIFNYYLFKLKNIKQIKLPQDNINFNWLAIPLLTEKRLELLTFLENNNIQTRVCFAGNITRHPAYRNYLKEFKNADQIMKEGFLLGAHHGMTIQDVDYICEKIKYFFNQEV